VPRSINDIATIYAGTFIVSWLYMDTKEDMIQEQLKGRGISDERVLNAMKTIDRELFVPDEYKEEAYRDGPLPIGRGQTISQPYIVAYMAQVLNPDPDDKILEVGSGCGYNAAVLSQLAAEVYSVEIVEWLAKFARENLNSAGIKNVKVRHGDGYEGWEEKGPFDHIILTATAPHIPDSLKKQLKVGGKILGPFTNSSEKLMVLEKTGEDEFKKHDLIHVRFVPMTGKAQESK